MIALTVDELGAALEETLRRAAHGERFVIHLDGSPAAILLGPDDPLGKILAPELVGSLESQ